MAEIRRFPLSPALQRAMTLLSDPPSDPQVSRGYLDLLGGAGDAAPPPNTGAIQRLWASPFGSMFYDNAQAVARRLLEAWQHPIDWLDIPAGGVALDVGCGPGSITASLARAVGEDGLALGVDVSEPMLARAVRVQAGAQAGFLRADAQRLPLRDNTVDAVISIAVLQLIPDPTAALGEMARVLKPGGRIALMVPTAGSASRLWKLLPKAGARVFDDDEIADTLERHGLTSVRVKNFGTVQWVRAKRH
ncbi:methyltransferase [Mycolicibacter terrae]|uniref:Methyltransferase n=1 Tax=Mycolicibacter terrae TaxID=1788 RepID=A0AAD1HZS9_9MYCO|nr:methyltransferase domain-containing protein [Mycolicibacter terrae]ORW94927.1 SAM-dependent methyltransferase [Mycolicibacter terrae]BBX23270.1 methyltransferase [Mycolicibacter terrae]SNV65742.1 methyltransferase type 11 [Mycolicibacter terrae]